MQFLKIYPSRVRGLFLSLLVTAVPAIASTEFVPDPLGEQLFCDTAPESNPYCTKPEIRLLVFERHKLIEALMQAPSIKITGAMGLGLKGTLPGFIAIPQLRSKTDIAVNLCRAEEACITTALQRELSTLRTLAGLSADAPSISAEEAAAASAGQDDARAALERASQAIDEEYSAVWEETRALLAPPDDPDQVPPLFAFKFPSPDRFGKERRQRCRDDIQCLAKRPQLLDTLVGRKDRAIRENTERQQRLAAQEQERKRQEAARAAQIAEQERQRAARQAALRAIDVDAIMPRGSLLRPLLDEGFEAFDRKTALPFATSIGEEFATTASFFGQPALAQSIRDGAIENRRNLVAAAYGLSRRDVFGFCGDSVDEVYRRTTPGTTTRTLGGVTISRQKGIDVYVRAPRPFSRFVQASHFESGVKDFEHAISRLDGCDGPLLRHIEQNLINYATNRSFRKWNP